MVTGYNDSADGFIDGVSAILDEARTQGVATVLWLSLRTEGVDYEEPLHRANGASYRGANRSLYALASEADGAHLASPGVDALTDFIAGQLDVVLAGGTVTLDPPPWEDVRRGDEEPLEVDVQEALVATTTTTTTTSTSPATAPRGQVAAAASAPVSPVGRVVPRPTIARSSDTRDALWVVVGVSPAVAWLVLRWVREHRPRC